LLKKELNCSIMVATELKIVLSLTGLLLQIKCPGQSSCPTTPSNSSPTAPGAASAAECVPPGPSRRSSGKAGTAAGDELDGDSDALASSDSRPTRRILKSLGQLRNPATDSFLGYSTGNAAESLAADPVGGFWAPISTISSHDQRDSRGMGGIAAAGYAATTMCTVLAMGLAVRGVARWVGGSGKAVPGS
jgi:hypothetical protein